MEDMCNRAKPDGMGISFPVRIRSRWMGRRSGNVGRMGPWPGAPRMRPVAAVVLRRCAQGGVWISRERWRTAKAHPSKRAGGRSSRRHKRDVMILGTRTDMHLSDDECLYFRVGSMEVPGLRRQYFLSLILTLIFLSKRRI